MSLEWGARTYVMGIVNVTPDSFSGDGLLESGAWLASVVEQAKRFEADGADIIDIGGESTRPGSQPISETEELRRVIPAVRVLRNETRALISVDTYRAAVARAAINEGADWINDVWGLRMDSEMSDVVAALGQPIVLMHNRSKPKDVVQEDRLGGRYIGTQYDDLIHDVCNELMGSVELALRHGIKESQIILDPGIGFGKTVQQNLRLIDELEKIKALGFPVLLGPSRKSFIGYTLDLAPDERLEGTAATVAIGIARGADIIRVHDVREMSRVARMTDAIVRR